MTDIDKLFSGMQDNFLDRYENMDTITNKDVENWMINSINELNNSDKEVICLFDTKNYDILEARNPKDKAEKEVLTETFEKASKIVANPIIKYYSKIDRKLENQYNALVKKHQKDEKKWKEVNWKLPKKRKKLPKPHQNDFMALKDTKLSKEARKYKKLFHKAIEHSLVFEYDNKFYTFIETYIKGEKSIHIAKTEFPYEKNKIELQEIFDLM